MAKRFRSRDSSPATEKPLDLPDDPGRSSKRKKARSEAKLTPAEATPQKSVARTHNDVGVIERVILKNFMNHSSLDFAFHRHVNFITGRNGTGKSALLTGLVVGLGGKASSTSRGSSLKGFVQDGKQVAEVTVHLSNSGLDAYEPSKYGDTLIIHRKLNVNGSSEYQLRSSTNKVISKRREDLDRILDHFNIQIENPIVVLNQEVSKNFLWSKGADDRYKFFMKATQLDQIVEDHQIATSEKDKTIEILRSKEEVLPRLQKEVNELEAKFKALKYRASNLQELREQLSRKERELLWASVELEESVVAEKEKDLKKKLIGRSKFDQKVSEAKASLAEAVKQRRDIEEDIKKAKAKADSCGQEHESAKRKMQALRKEQREAQVKLREIERQKKEMEQDRDQLRGRIEEIQNSSQNYKTMKKEQEEKITVLQRQLDALEADRRAKESELLRLGEGSLRFKEQKDDIEKDLKDLRRLRVAADERVKMLEASKSDVLRKYGPFMPELVRLVEQAFRQNRFHQKPRGPLGVYIKLKDPQFALAAESAIGKHLLSAFCVCDNHDFNELKLIMNRVCSNGSIRPPMVITTPFEKEVYDIRRHSVRSDSYRSLYDVLFIDDVVATNCLIDQRSIESIVLIKDGATARHVMRTSPPVNAHECYTGQGDQIFPSPGFRVYSQDKKNPTILSHDIDEDIRASTEKMADLDRQIAKKEPDLAIINRDIDRIVQAEKRAKKELQELSQKALRKTMELNDLRNADDTLPIDVTALQEEVDQYDVQLRSLAADCEAARERFSEISKAVDESQAVVSTTHAAVLQIISEGDPKKEELALAEQELERATHACRHYSTRLAEFDQQISTFEKEIAVLKKNVEKAVEKAVAVCPRIRVGTSTTALEREIVATRKTIERHEEQSGNLDEVAKLYNEAHERHEIVKRQIRQCRNFVEQLRKIIQDRAQNYQGLRELMAVRSKLLFQNLLSNRNYSGKMTFHHDRQQLDIIVSPSSNTTTAATKDLRGLSGGERSFSTLCFILSLWETVESPFRCMDEFDVFMDMVNRHIGMQMILRVAEEKRNKQFIILTPQNMSQIPVSDLVRIFQMPDPVRGHLRDASQRSSAGDEDN